ncbi:GSCOCG00013236001-RA-CDS [Cotesia congregata]|nr:GSCOCG00013236001-RA-CDS [Cotesia congregata]
MYTLFQSLFSAARLPLHGTFFHIVLGRTEIPRVSSRTLLLALQSSRTVCSVISFVRTAANFRIHLCRVKI